MKDCPGRFIAARSFVDPAPPNGNGVLVTTKSAALSLSLSEVLGLGRLAALEGIRGFSGEASVRGSLTTW
jgi:hypothetical protein